MLTTIVPDQNIDSETALLSVPKTRDGVYAVIDRGCTIHMTSQTNNFLHMVTLPKPASVTTGSDGIQGTAIGPSLFLYEHPELPNTVLAEIDKQLLVPKLKPGLHLRSELQMQKHNLGTISLPGGGTDETARGTSEEKSDDGTHASQPLSPTD